MENKPFEINANVLDNIEHWIIGDLDFLITEPDQFGHENDYSMDTVHQFIDNVPADLLGELIKSIRKHHADNITFHLEWIDKLRATPPVQQHPVTNQANQSA